MKLTTATAMVGLASLVFAAVQPKKTNAIRARLGNIDLPTQGTFEFTVCCSASDTTSSIPYSCSAVPMGSSEGCNGNEQYNCYFENGQIVRP
jgi:hypothetical protein